MRRAEKAGRERAEAWIKIWCAGNARIAGELASKCIPHQLRLNDSAFDREIGARNLSGRAYQSALEAYDRGYRARLTEALSTLTKGTP